MKRVRVACGLFMAAALSSCARDGEQTATATSEIVSPEPTPSAVLIYNERSLEGYASRGSVYPGQSIDFFLHVPYSDRTVTVSVVRLGAQNAPVAGAIGETAITLPSGATTEQRTIHPRPYPANASAAGANWQTPDFSITIPNPAPFGNMSTWAWRSGFFALKVTSVEGDQTTYVPFIVKPSGRQRYLPTLVAATNTWTANNHWPYRVNPALESDRALSVIPGALTRDIITGVFDDARGARREVVSRLRPNPNAALALIDLPTAASGVEPSRAGYAEYRTRTESLLVAELRTAAWFERWGIQYNVITDDQLDESPQAVGSHNLSAEFDPVLVFSGSSEYWTANMYQNLARYMRAGGSVLNMAGNIGLKQTSINANGFLENLGQARWPDELISSTFGVRPSMSSGGRCAPFQLSVFGTSIIGTSTQVPIKHSLSPLLDCCTAGNVSVMNSFAAAHSPTFMFGTEWQPPSTTRSFCNDEQLGALPAAAIGWKTDAASARPGFFRQYNVVASGVTADRTGQLMPAGMVFARLPSGGMILSAGSALFSASLLGELSQPRPLTEIVRTFLARTTTRVFSDFVGNSGLANGHTDLIGWNSSPSSGHLFRYDTDSQGNVISIEQLPEPAGTWNSLGYTRLLVAGDWNDNGSTDLVGVTAAGATYLHDGGSIAARSQLPNTVAGADTVLAPGDFDGDGRMDLLARVGDDLILQRGVYSAYSYRLSGGWSPFVKIFAAGDLNFDGLPDLLVVRSAGWQGWQLVASLARRENGRVTIDAPPLSGGHVVASLTSSAATFVAAGDLDANGLPDFMFSDSAGELHRCLNPDWAGVGTPTQPYSHGYFVNHPDFESTTPNTTTNALAGANCPVINHGWQIFPQLQSAW